MAPGDAPKRWFYHDGRSRGTALPLVVTLRAYLRGRVLGYKRLSARRVCMCPEALARAVRRGGRPPVSQNALGIQPPTLQSEALERKDQLVKSALEITAQKCQKLEQAQPEKLKKLETELNEKLEKNREAEELLTQSKIAQMEESFMTKKEAVVNYVMQKVVDFS